MRADTTDYVAFLLRLWREDMNGQQQWRAALQDALTLEQRHFANVEALIGFLHDGYARCDAGPATHEQQLNDE